MIHHTLLVKHLDLQVNCTSRPDAHINVTGLNILYTNIDQLLNKRDDLEMAIAGNEPDIILITEILPKARWNTLSTARLSLNGYSSIFNFDPDSTHSSSVRGMGIYVSEKLSFCEVQFDHFDLQ